MKSLHIFVLGCLEFFKKQKLLHIIIFYRLMAYCSYQNNDLTKRGVLCDRKIYIRRKKNADLILLMST